MENAEHAEGVGVPGVQLHGAAEGVHGRAGLAEFQVDDTQLAKRRGVAGVLLENHLIQLARRQQAA